MSMVAKGVATTMNKKTVSISSGRQITIPKKFFSALEFANQAECFIRGNELIIRPIKTVSGGEFAEQILEELISKGLSGTKLLAEFKAAQAKIRPAVEAMIAEAEDVANNNGEYFTFDDVFGSEEE